MSLVEPVPTGLAGVAPRDRAVCWAVFAFGAALVLGAVVFFAAGGGDGGIRAALLATARFMFLLFWPAYAGGALAALFGPAFAPLRDHARELGLAFAAALAVHLGFVAWLCLIGDPPPVKTFLVFGAAVVCIVVLTAFSIGRLRQSLGPRGWTLLRFVAMNYVALAFIADFFRVPVAGGPAHAVLYWPFMALALAAPALRFGALLKKQALR